MSVRDLTDAQLESRLDMLEVRIQRAHSEDLPYLNAAFGKLLEEQVRRDMEEAVKKRETPSS